MTEPASPPDETGSSLQTAPGGTVRSARRSSDVDRRTVVVAALILLVAVVGGTVLVATLVDGEPTERPVVDGSGEVFAPPPAIVPQPNSGRAPEEAGDRGGWGQLALLGGIVVAMGGIAAVVARGSRQARANRAAWRDAGATGRDGVLDDRS